MSQENGDGANGTPRHDDNGEQLQDLGTTLPSAPVGESVAPITTAAPVVATAPESDGDAVASSVAGGQSAPESSAEPPMGPNTVSEPAPGTANISLPATDESANKGMARSSSSTMLPNLSAKDRMTIDRQDVVRFLQSHSCYDFIPESGKVNTVIGVP